VSPLKKIQMENIKKDACNEFITMLLGQSYQWFDSKNWNAFNRLIYF
jgi:hypothetical protein